MRAKKNICQREGSNRAASLIKKEKINGQNLWIGKLYSIADKCNPIATMQIITKNVFLGSQ